MEIGAPWIKTIFPEQTLCFSTFHTRRTAEPENGLFNISLRTLPKLHSALNAPDLSLVICRPLFYPPWHWQWIARELFSRRALQGNSYIQAALGAQVLRRPIGAPIAVLDTEDYPAIKHDRFFLLSRCQLYFKRELPPDRWRLFMGTAHANVPSPRFRQRSPLRDNIAKFRPLPLGLPSDGHGVLPLAAREKTTDVFFAGDTQNSSTVRSSGMLELAALRERGLVVDIPQSRLPLPEFYRRAANAWLVWSPEGLGWDCFRHYEALACGSVPIISQPTIERYRPLIDGEHAFYYDSSAGDLSRTILGALADKDRLRTMASAGQAHVMAHHTQDAIARYVVETTLAAARDDVTRAALE
ncbi:MAG TPA: glycosyltransferase [Pirellulales bacterium]|nr:glycosyltransferase [Pirellulales bacterium]